MELFTAAQMKEIDRVAIEERGIPSTLLMERAAKALVKEVLALPLPGPKKASRAVAFVASPKNGCMPSKEELTQLEKEYHCHRDGCRKGDEPSCVFHLYSF